MTIPKNIKTELAKNNIKKCDRESMNEFVAFNTSARHQPIRSLLSTRFLEASPAIPHPQKIGIRLRPYYLAKELALNINLLN